MSKMLRLGVVIALATITTVLPGSAENRRTSIMPIEKEPLFRVPKDVKDVADSSQFLELSAILYAVDSMHWDYIKGTSTMERFRERIADHQNNHPELWLTAMSGLEWAKDSAHCQGNVWQPEVDARWPYFIRFGPPSAYWSPQYQVRVPGGGGRVDTTVIFFNYWESSRGDTGLAAQLFKAEWYPPESSSVFPKVQQIFGDTIKSEFGKDLYPEMDIASFANEDGTYDIAVVGWITGNRLTRETIVDQRELWAELKIFRNDSLVWSAEQTQKLGLNGLVLSVTENDEDLSLTHHFTVTHFPKGEYEAKLVMRGDHNNIGKYRKKFPVPSIFPDNEGISDVFLVNREPVRGSSVAEGLLRYGHNQIGRGSHDFNAGDTLSLYVEVPMPKESHLDSLDATEWAYLNESESQQYFGDSTYSGNWLLLKARLEPDKKKIVPSDNTEVIPTHDSLDSPLLIFDSVDVQKAFAEMMRKSREEKEKEKQSLHFLSAQVIRASEGTNTALFESSFRVVDIESGRKYWIVVTAEAYDSFGQKLLWEKTTRTPIRGKPKVITLGGF
ncbi:MAG: hypothetical protein AAB594_00660 [Patescibacteria group bacterium]